MWPALLLAAILAGPLADDPIGTAVERFKALTSYQATLVSSDGAATEVIRYYYRKPGDVRMELVEPWGGAVMVYRPGEKVRLWPFGLGGPGFRFSPENWLVRSAKGHRVDRSDFGALLDNVRALAQQGRSEVLGLERLGGREVLRVRVQGAGDHTVGGVREYELWLDLATVLPAKVIARDRGGEVLEEVTLKDLKVDVAFPDGFFNP